MMERALRWGLVGGIALTAVLNQLAAAHPGTVRMQARATDGAITVASGVIYSAEHKLILTCKHWCDDLGAEADYSFQSFDGAGNPRGAPVNCEPLLLAEENDLALFRAAGFWPGWKGAVLAENNPQPGDRCFSIACPGGRNPHTKIVRVRQPYTAQGEYREWQSPVIETSYIGGQGVSGGPLYNERGRLVGIHSTGKRDEGFSLSYDVTAISALLAKHEAASEESKGRYTAGAG